MMPIHYTWKVTCRSLRFIRILSYNMQRIFMSPTPDDEHTCLTTLSTRTITLRTSFMNSGFGQRQKVPNHWWQIAHFRMMIVDLIFVDRKSNRRRIKVYHVLVMSDELGAGWSTASSPLRPESDSSLVAGSIVGGSDKKTRPKPWTNKEIVRKLLATN